MWVGLIFLSAEYTGNIFTIPRVTNEGIRLLSTLSRGAIPKLHSVLFAKLWRKQQYI